MSNLITSKDLVISHHTERSQLNCRVVSHLKFLEPIMSYHHCKFGDPYFTYMRYPRSDPTTKENPSPPIISKIWAL